MNRIDWHEADLAALSSVGILPRRRGNPGGKSVVYCDQFATFDIETSKTTIPGRFCADGKPEHHAFCYVWMMYFPHADTMVTGRTIGEYIEFMTRLSPLLPACLVVYVHNLSYEFQFLSGVYDFANGDVFAIKSRKVAKCTMLGNVEYRCSQILSNMSLSLYTKKYGVAHGKLSGDEYDYTKLRYPWTELTPREWDYCTNDVVGLAECIQVELSMGYTLSTIPLTSTGFVRRDLKRAMRDVSHSLVPSMQPPYHVYKMLRAAFRGGDVHADRYHANQIVDNVKSYDRSSSYPDVLCNCMFPMSKFCPVEDLSDSNIVRLINARKALLMRIQIRDCKLKNHQWPDPYLSSDKCDVLEEANGDRAQYDNGRILRAPLVITTVTDIDYAIITEQYSGEYTILECWAARYGWLPWPYTDCVRAYYDSKTRLKGDSAQAAFYEKSKNKLNSCYGCAAQDPVKMPSWYYGGYWFDADSPAWRKICGVWIEPDSQAWQALPPVDPALQELCKDDQQRKKLCPTAEEIYADYCKTSWSLYAWGVWCTAWARLRLYEGIKLVSHLRPDSDDIIPGKHSCFLYCDTDSVKYTGDADWTAYNAQRKQCSIEQKAFATDATGKTHYMGVYEPDGEYEHFMSLGSKKYVYQQGGELHCTISGVNKKKAPAEIMRAGGIERLIYNQRSGLFTFRDAGGTELEYNDEKYYTTLEIDGHKLEITRNVAIMDSTYTLGMTTEYYALLSTCMLDLE